MNNTFRELRVGDSLARRRYQRGSLAKEGNRWIARWREDVVLPSGQVKRIRKRQALGNVEELPTKKLAQRELDRRLEPINREDYRPTPQATFAEFAGRWQNAVMVHHKPSTQRSERSVIRAQLIPTFGGLSLKAIQPEMLQCWVSQHTAAPKTVRNIVVTMQAMWATATAWNYAQHDPFAGLRLPTVIKGNTHHFTVEETLAIIDKAEGKWKTFFRILAETGMRPGELAGLRTCDVGVRSVRITQAVWQRQIQTPKTATAMRSFAISAALGQAIREMVVEAEPNSYGLVFASQTGRPLSMDNFRHRVLGPILTVLCIVPNKRCGLYAFRHMNATLMDNLGTPLKTRQKRLGHADVTTTLTHYSHAVDADDRAAADALGALLSPGGTRSAAYPDALPPDILAHPVIHAEIMRQVALALGRRP